MRKKRITDDGKLAASLRITYFREKEPAKMLEPATGLYWTELRIFLEVARARSFNRAAQSLGVSQNTELLAAGARLLLTPAGSRPARAPELIDAQLLPILIGHA
jgi:hypothetical protein